MSELVQVLKLPGGWTHRAACRDADPEIFYPEKGGRVEEARAICFRCPVRAECLEWALENNERYGLWGGLSERQRRPLFAERGRAA